MALRYGKPLLGILSTTQRYIGRIGGGGFPKPAPNWCPIPAKPANKRQRTPTSKPAFSAGFIDDIALARMARLGT